MVITLATMTVVRGAWAMLTIAVAGGNTPLGLINSV